MKIKPHENYPLYGMHIEVGIRRHFIARKMAKDKSQLLTDVTPHIAL